MTIFYFMIKYWGFDFVWNDCTVLKFPHKHAFGNFFYV